MREIKFRAWYSPSGFMSRRADAEMRFVEELIFRPGNAGIAIRTNGQECYNPGCFKIMQYTGLKDKNGIEIYEGDIIEVDGVGPRGAFYRQRYVAKWKTHKTYHGWKPVPQTIARNGYVIGNRFENPELLEAQDAETD